MTASTLDSQEQVINDLHRGLHRALSEIHPEKYGATLYLKQIDSGGPRQSSFRIEGPEGLCVEARCTVPPVDDSVHDIQVEIIDGPTQRFRYCPSDTSTDADETVRLGHTVVAFLLDEMERRLGRALFQEDSSVGTGLQVPMLSLNREGTIQNLTEAARRVLEYSSEATLNSCFFSHVHGDNLRRVMRDLARMVCHCKKHCQWLLRLRTGNRRWRWYRAKVRNHLDTQEGFIQVRLRPL